VFSGIDSPRNGVTATGGGWNDKGRGGGNVFIIIMRREEEEGNERTNEE